MKNVPKQIQEFWDQLEYINSFDRWELMKQLKPLTEMFDFQWNDILIAEHICLRFLLKDGELIFDDCSVDANGKETGFPSFNVFSDVQVNYLIERSQSTKNPLLIARYNHILHYSLKNRKYGIRALKAYRSLASRKLDNDGFDIFISAIQAIIKLTEKIKIEIKTIKEELIEILLGNKIDVSQKAFVSTLLINSSLFKSYELEFLPELSLQWVSKPNETGYFNNKEILNNAIKICINNGLDTSKYFDKLAENELIILSEHTEESDFVRLHILGEIVQYYKKSKNVEKFEQYLSEYTKAKTKIELCAFDFSPNSEELNTLNEEINRNLEIMLKWDIDKILYFFSVHTPIFPEIDKITEVAKENINKSFLKYATSSVFDINNNIKTLSDKEILENEIFAIYSRVFGINVLTTFIRVFQVCTFNRKITYQHIYSYLDQNSWLGHNIEESSLRSHSKNNTYKWLNLMAPALHSFITQLETSFLRGENLPYTNWILSIDSLTLKFEGALRDLIKMTGGNASVIKNNIIQEMLLDDLLNCEKAKEIFSINDLALFKIIFTKKGENIRHSVAHGFYHSADYSIEKCCKIFLCIMRLSSFNLKKSNPN